MCNYLLLFWRVGFMKNTLLFPTRQQKYSLGQAMIIATFPHTIPHTQGQNRAKNSKLQQGDILIIY
jgi:hypothetical protein